MATGNVCMFALPLNENGQATGHTVLTPNRSETTNDLQQNQKAVVLKTR